MSGNPGRGNRAPPDAIRKRLENAHSMDFQTLSRTLWIYWDQGEEQAPFLVRQCILSWRLRNPGWTVRVLDRNALRETIDLDGLDRRADIPLQALSDVIRVMLLTSKGGVWADASLFCTRALDSWLPAVYADHFFAFASRKKDRLMTTWFLAGDSDSELLRRWAGDMIEFWRSNRFRKAGYWGRQLMRKLTSLRKRNIVSNDIWFSRLLLKRLGLFPYPVNMYLFERSLDRDPRLETQWRNRAHLYDTPAEHLQNTLGMNSPSTEASRAFIAGSDTPVHKLNWRQDLGHAHEGSNFAFLLSRLQAPG